MEPTLKHGIGAPYLALFNSQGDPLKDPKTGIYISEYVTDFQYRTSESSEETPAITAQLQYEDATLMDNPDLHCKKIIHFQYGYVFSDGSFTCSPAYTMKILRFDMFLSDQACKYTLYATDATLELKYSGACIPDGTSGNTLLDRMDEGFSDGTEEYPIIIKKFLHYDQ